MRLKRDIPTRRIGVEKTSFAGGSRVYAYTLLTWCEQHGGPEYAAILQNIRARWDRCNYGRPGSPLTASDMRTLNTIKRRAEAA